MTEKISDELSNRVIALPESRQLNILANMLEKRGAEVIRCPLVTILDTPEPQPVYDWLENCINEPYDDFIILTGEGIRRLYGFAERINKQTAFLEALQRMRKIARGPKPGQALRSLGLKTDLLAEAPTTDGVILTLEQLNLSGRHVAVQLYGSDPNTKLIEYLNRKGIQPATVAPYVYASDSEQQQVETLIDQLAAGKIDAIAFTSKPQLKRLRDVAEKTGKSTILAQALQSTTVAAVGPVVAAELEKASIRVDLMPEESYFMKPMVSKLVEKFNTN